MLATTPVQYVCTAFIGLAPRFTSVTIILVFLLMPPTYFEGFLDVLTNANMGRCYDHNFLQKNWRFSQKPMLWSKFCIFYLCFESKTPIFSQFFCENIFKIITSVPDQGLPGLHFIVARFCRRKARTWHRIPRLNVLLNTGQCRDHYFGRLGPLFGKK
jgi:hypothetical protein